MMNRLPHALVVVGPRTTAWVVLAICVAQALLWASALGLTFQTPEHDSLEQVVWAYSAEAGYWKHPPLPTWIMHGLIRLFGLSPGLPFFAAQACIAIALFLTWRLGARLMPGPASVVALGLTSVIAYHNVFGDSYNHNTVLLPFQAAVAWLFYRATRSGSPLAWGLAGLAAGLAMLVKYVALFPLAALAIYFVIDRGLHHRRNFAGVALAAVVFGAVVAPHAAWLFQNDFAPFAYARGVTRTLDTPGDMLGNLVGFFASQALRLLPFAIVGWWVLRRSPRASGPASAPSDRLFLWIAGAGPLVLMLAYGVATQTEILNRWGANCFLLAGWLLVDAAGRAIDTKVLARAVVAVTFAHLVACAGFALGSTQLAKALDVRSSANFPGAEVARMAQDVWSSHEHDRPLRIVISTVWLGGSVALHAPHAPAVLVDGEYARAPWITPADVAACGALVLVDETTGTRKAVAGEWTFLRAARVTGELELSWANARRARSDLPPGKGRIVWGVVAPAAGAGTCRL